MKRHRSHQQRRRSRSAFALIELLICIGLVLLAMNIATRLFAVIIRSYRDAPAASRALQSEEQWLGVLRSDAWSASDQYLIGSSQITFVVDAQPIVWRQENDKLIRQIGEEQRQWPLPHALAWSVEDSILTMRSGDVRIALATPAHEAVTP